MNLCGHHIGNRRPLFLVAGPCVVEPGSMAVDIAGELAEIAKRHEVFFVFKASFDKANRSSSKSYRGVGMNQGIRTLDEVKRQIGVPVLTDVHERTPLGEVASVVDVLQTPAFLVRQTDFMQGVARAGKPMNVKKGQFLAPWDMENVIAKCNEVGNYDVMLCERGTMFGYNNLVVDMRGLPTMRKLGRPVVFDATHSAQLPGAGGDRSSGQREMVPVLARAAVAAGVAGLFLETHPKPDDAPSDGPNMWPLGRVEELLTAVLELDRVVKSRPYLEDGEA